MAYADYTLTKSIKINRFEILYLTSEMVKEQGTNYIESQELFANLLPKYLERIRAGFLFPRLTYDGMRYDLTPATRSAYELLMKPSESEDVAKSRISESAKSLSKLFSNDHQLFRNGVVYSVRPALVAINDIKQVDLHIEKFRQSCKEFKQEQTVGKATVACMDGRILMGDCFDILLKYKDQVGKSDLQLLEADFRELYDVMCKFAETLSEPLHSRVYGFAENSKRRADILSSLKTGNLGAAELELMTAVFGKHN